MHILILPSWYPGTSQQAGLFIFEQIRALSRVSGLNLSVINWGPNEYVLKIRNSWRALQTLLKFPTQKASIIEHNPQFTEYKLPHLSWYSKIGKGNYPAILPKLLAKIAEIEQTKGKIDLIHAHVTFPAGYLASRISEQLFIPYLITEHSGPFPFREFVTRQGVRDIVLKPLEKASAIIAVSSWLAHSIFSHAGRKPIVISNSVDTEFFSITQSSGNPASKGNHTIPVIFCLSWLTLEKGMSDFLLALSLLKQKNLVFQVRIGGSGKDERKLRQMAITLGLAENILWLGQIGRQRVRDEYQSCSFYVMPSRLESLSMVILEAGSCGKPVVATDCGGPRDLISPEQGILVEAANPTALGAGIEYMIANYESYLPEQIRDCIKQRFSDQVITEQILQVYQQLITGR